MTASPSSAAPLTFTPHELELLARTADALSAYMGKPVLAEVVDAEEAGFEWVIFAVPLESEATCDATVQIGGPNARLLGQKGGLTLHSDDVFECEFLWAIQLTDVRGIRFIKIDGHGNEVAWTETLNEILPFVLNDTPVPEDDDNDEDDDDSPEAPTRQ
ncbi:MAG TPA: hypothetical protein VFR20_02340 [Burkholderiaceae bacterium]|nr:hypothetical protein [Burkholderiaceae bacterium]